jgi:sortase (surface protein transpeptidase)
MLVGVVVFATTAVHAFWYAPQKEIPAPVGVHMPVVAASDYPVHVSIPASTLDADIEKIGLVGEHQIAAPSHFSEVGWYKYGAVPGQVGTALLAGHLDNGLGLDGAFKHLSSLSKGDVITVTTASSTVLHFTVDRTEIFPYDSVPTDTLLGTSVTDGKAHLVLITCEGKWTHDPIEGMTYDHRFVVFATETV